MQLVNKQNHVLGPADFVHDGLDPFLKLAAVLRAGDHEREVEGNQPFVAQQFGHIAGRNFLGQSLNDGRFANAGFAQKHRIVLCAPAENLNHPFNLVFASDDRVHVPFAGNLGEVAAKGLERGGFYLSFFAAAGGFARGLGFLGFVRRLEVGTQFAENLVPGFLNVHVQILQHHGRHAFALTQQSQQNMFRPHVRVT